MYQTPENILKLIFKVVTKHWKIRQFSRKCSLENEQFSKKHQYWNKQSNVSLKHISQLGQQSYGLHVVSHGKTGQNFLTGPDPTRPRKYLTRTPFFYLNQKRIDPWPDSCFLRVNPTRPNLQPKPFFKTFFLVKK